MHTSVCSKLFIVNKYVCLQLITSAFNAKSLSQPRQRIYVNNYTVILAIYRVCLKCLEKTTTVNSSDQDKEKRSYKRISVNELCF